MTENEWSKFMQWLLEGVLTGAAAYAVKILSDMKSSLTELNLRVAGISEKLTWHEKVIDKHDETIQILQSGCQLFTDKKKR